MQSNQRSEPRGGFLAEDQLDLEPPKGLRSSLRHLSPGCDGRSSCLLLPQRSGSRGGACPEPSASCCRNLGTYFPGDGAEAVAGAEAAEAATGSAGCVDGISAGAAVDLPKSCSRLRFSFSSASFSLCLCLSAISSNFALYSASSFFRLSASAHL